MVLEIVKSSRRPSKSGGVAPAELDEALSIFVGCVRRMRSRLSWLVCATADYYPDGKTADGCLRRTRPVSILFPPHLSQSDQAAAPLSPRRCSEN